MQFHLNGFEPGDPEFSNLNQRPDLTGTPGPLPEKVDVLIVGSGPAGLTLAAQLSALASGSPRRHTGLMRSRSGSLMSKIRKLSLGMEESKTPKKVFLSFLT